MKTQKFNDENFLEELTMQTILKHSTLSVDAWSNGAEPSWSFPMIEALMAGLAPIEEVWANLPDSAAITQLQKREQLLGVATISCRTFTLLHEIITEAGMPNEIQRHAPSMTAAAKQAVLDGGRQGIKQLVNKTVTVRLGTMHLLCTGAGDFTVNRSILSRVASELALPRRVVKNCRINPADYSPEYEVGLLTGMVSPFFPPAPTCKRLQAVVLVRPSLVDAAEEHKVSISLSPFESLVVPLDHFDTLAQRYVQRAHPHLQWAVVDCEAAPAE